MISTNKKRLRKHFFVDPRIQGAIVLRIVLYWTASMIATAGMVFYWRSEASLASTALSPLAETWFYCGPVLIVYFLLLPLVVVDIIRFSNRIVGPMVRLRRAMRQLARGQRVEPLEFRGNDMWRELASEFNAVASHAQGHPVTSQRAAWEEPQPAEPQTADC